MSEEGGKYADGEADTGGRKGEKRKASGGERSWLPVAKGTPASEAPTPPSPTWNRSSTRGTKGDDGPYGASNPLLARNSESMSRRSTESVSIRGSLEVDVKDEGEEEEETKEEETKEDAGKEPEVEKPPPPPPPQPAKPGTAAVIVHLKKWQKSVPTLLPDAHWRRAFDSVVLALMMVPGITAPLSLVDTLPMESLQYFVLATCPFWIADTFIRSRTAYTGLDGKLVTAKDSVLKRYLREWAVIDILSVPPWIAIANQFDIALPIKKVCAALLLLRLWGVPSLFARSNLPLMTPPYVTFYLGYAPVFKAIFWSILALHILVVLKIAVRVEGVQNDNRYDYALFWVWNLLTTSPAPLTLESYMQKVYCFFLMICGVFFQGVIIGKLSYELLKRSIHEQNVDTIRTTLSLITQYKVPTALQQEVLSLQWHALQSSLSALARSEILDSLPSVMRNEITLYMKIDLVEKVPMFSNAPKPTQMLIASHLEQLYVEPGQAIVTVGDIGAEMFFILHGYCDVFVPNVGTVGMLSRGQFFGEIALLTSDKRSATITALTYCDVMRLQKVDFDAVCDTDDTFKARILEEVAKRQAAAAKVAAEKAAKSKEAEVAKEAEVVKEAEVKTETVVDTRHGSVAAASSVCPSPPHESPRGSVHLGFPAASSRGSVRSVKSFKSSRSNVSNIHRFAGWTADEIARQVARDQSMAEEQEKRSSVMALRELLGQDDEGMFGNHRRSRRPESVMRPNFGTPDDGPVATGPEKGVRSSKPSEAITTASAPPALEGTPAVALEQKISELRNDLNSGLADIKKEMQDLRDLIETDIKARLEFSGTVCQAPMSSVPQPLHPGSRPRKSVIDIGGPRASVSEMLGGGISNAMAMGGGRRTSVLPAGMGPPGMRLGGLRM
eukprot:Hpha_TRINITY_DN15763_c6_g1::TRINITY_DN15763_c6_g1_i1::g.37078::m.37078